jgi:hypothetical protein
MNHVMTWTAILCLTTVVELATAARRGMTFIMQPATAALVLGCFVLSEPYRLAAQTTVLKDAAVITPENIMRHIRTLASDEFEGRGPGSTGEKQTVEYLIHQFREFGLQPGNPDGTYIQRVPISVIKSSGTATFHTCGPQNSVRAPHRRLGGLFGQVILVM